MRALYNTLLLSLFAFSIATPAHAKEDCFPKKSNKLVNDYVNTIDDTQEQALEYKLAQFAKRTSTQIAIVLVDDLCGYDKAQYTFELGEKWGVGQKGFDNGVVIMVKPTGGKGQRHTFIAIGYGLEEVIPDAIAKRIVEREMIPRFKEGRIYEGIDAASTVVMQLAEGKFSADQYDKAGRKPVGLVIIAFLLFFGLFFFIAIRRARSYAAANDVSFWVAWSMLNASRRSHGGHYSSFSSGSGGFGGFGGGSFGGGGAGGSW